MGASASCAVKRHKFVDGLRLSVNQIKELRDSWAVIKEVGAEQFGVLTFDGLITECPETLALFDAVKDLKDWKNSRAFRHHCKTTFSTIGHFVAIIHDKDLMDRNIDYMGMRHSGFAITPHHFEVFGEQILKSLEKIMGDKMTPGLRDTWIIFYLVLSTSIQRTTDKYNEEFNFERCQKEPTLNGEEEG